MRAVETPIRGAPLHVVHVLASLGPGGLENGVVHVIGGSDPALVRHSVVCLDAAGDLARRLPPGVPVHVVGRRPGTDLRALLHTAQLVRSLGPDVVHSRNWASLVEGALAARAARARHVHGLHGRTAAELEGVSRRRRLIEGRLARGADRVVVLLEALREDALALRVRPERVTVLENGVDHARFRPDHAARTRVRAELGAGPRDVVFGCVARLDPVKDHPTLFRAFTKVGSRGLLVLVGDGPRRRSLETLANVDGIAARVRFLGHRADPSPLYPAFDVFALASRYEASSNTALEAMAAGVPVVATRVGGNPSLVPPGAGVLVPPGDPDALGAALGSLARDSARRAELGLGAFAVARGRTLERMARAYEQLYLEVGSRLASGGSAPAPADVVCPSAPVPVPAPAPEVPA